MRRLGEDEHGTWLYSPVGNIVQFGDGGTTEITRWAAVRLVPAGQWWTAMFHLGGSCEIYCDITTPPRWTNPGEVVMADLELDVCRTMADRRVELLDEDEFAAARVEYTYPADLVDQATEAAHRLYRALRENTEPFATRYRTWFAATAGTR